MDKPSSITITKFSKSEIEGNIQTPKGPVGFMAVPAVEGNKLILKNVVVYGEGVEAREPGALKNTLPREMMAAYREVEKEAGKLGFTKLEIADSERSLKSTSATPGRKVHLQSDLVKKGLQQEKMPDLSQSPPAKSQATDPAVKYGRPTPKPPDPAKSQKPDPLVAKHGKPLPQSSDPSKSRQADPLTAAHGRPAPSPSSSSSKPSLSSGGASISSGGAGGGGNKK